MVIRRLKSFFLSKVYRFVKLDRVRSLKFVIRIFVQRVVFMRRVLRKNDISSSTTTIFMNESVQGFEIRTKHFALFAIRVCSCDCKDKNTFRSLTMVRGASRKTGKFFGQGTQNLRQQIGAHSSWNDHSRLNSHSLDYLSTPFSTLYSTEFPSLFA